MFDKKIINPEFTRNIWTELSPNRLILMPLIVGVIYLIAYLSKDSWDTTLETMTLWHYVISGILLFLWGTKLISDSVISEVNQRTWISQKMTPVSAIDMTVGKLFGSTIYPWYGFLISTLIYIPFLLQSDTPLKDAVFILVFLLIAVLVHAVTLILSLLIINKQRDQSKKIRSVLFFILSIVGAAYLLALAFAGFHSNNDELIKWYFLEKESFISVLMPTLFFAVWAFLGAYSSMKRELQIPFDRRNWPLFILTSSLFMAGFQANIQEFILQEHFALFLSILGAIAIVLAYFTLFAEQKGIVNYRLMLEKIQKTQFLSDYVPLWGIALFIGAVAVVVVQIYILIMGNSLKIYEEINNPLFPITVMLFVIRDFSLIIFNSLTAKAGRADITALVYLMILYILLPALAGVSGADEWLFIFYPDVQTDILKANIPIFIQAAIMLVVMLNVLKRKLS